MCDARQRLCGRVAGAPVGNCLVCAIRGDYPGFHPHENEIVAFYPQKKLSGCAVFPDRRDFLGSQCLDEITQYGGGNPRRRFLGTSAGGRMRDLVLYIQGVFARQSGLYLSAIAHRNRKFAVVAAPLLRACCTVVLWRYRNTWSRPFLLAWGFFCVVLAPVMGFMDTLFMQVSLVADHYQHIAVIGLIALASVGFSAWCLHTRAWARGTAIAAAGLAAGILGLATWRQCMLYHDNFTLFRDTLKKNPACWIAQYDLGVITARRLAQGSHRILPQNSATVSGMRRCKLRHGQCVFRFGHGARGCRTLPGTPASKARPLRRPLQSG